MSQATDQTWVLRKQVYPGMDKIVYRDVVQTINEDLVAEVYGSSKAEQRQRAALIAAAPFLYRALQMALDADLRSPLASSIFNDEEQEFITKAMEKARPEREVQL